MKSTITSGKNKIYFWTEGQGAPIIWIHGGGVDHRMWKPQISYFKGSYQVIAYDLRGHGQSAYKENERADIEDLFTLMNFLKLSSAHVVGLSLGAVIALDFVLAYPDRVHKLVLISPGVVGVQETEPSYLETIIKLGKTLEAGYVDAAADIIHAMTFVGQRKKEPEGFEEAMDYVRSTFTRYIESGNITRMPQLTESNPVARLHEITSPTLVIHGKDDLAYMAKNVEALKEGIPHAQLQTLTGAGHLVNVELADETNGMIEAFLGAP